MLVGYASNSKGYELWDAERGKIITIRDVRFDETFSTPRSKSCDVHGSPDSENEF